MQTSWLNRLLNVNQHRTASNNERLQPDPKLVSLAGWLISFYCSITSSCVMFVCLFVCTIRKLYIERGSIFIV